MNVVLGSAFRNSAGGAPYYMARAAQLRTLLESLGLGSLRIVAVEGDSVDTTRAALVHEAGVRGLTLSLHTCNHGGPDFGSTESIERMTALSKVGNAIFDGIVEHDDILIYVESDLFWTADVMVHLLRNAIGKRGGFDIFSPLVLAGEVFYDIWGFRGLDGRRFSPFSPFYPGLEEGKLFEVGSVGSCLVMPGEIARRVRIVNDYCLVGWCQNAREQGFRIAVCPTLAVRQA